MTSGCGDVVDLVFGLRGSTIAVDYADLLWERLCAAQPWLGDEPALSVHPLGRIGHGDGCIYLSRHSRLVLRLPESRVEEARRLCGSRIDLGGAATLGTATVKPLKAERVLYSHCVLAGAEDEGEFVAACRGLLGDIMITSAQLLVGKVCRARVGGRQETGYSLMVHGCSGEESLRLQGTGLGAGRQRGCGIFVPHKSVTAVGGD